MFSCLWLLLLCSLTYAGLERPVSISSWKPPGPQSAHHGLQRKRAGGVWSLRYKPVPAQARGHPCGSEPGSGISQAFFWSQPQHRLAVWTNWSKARRQGFEGGSGSKPRSSEPAQPQDASKDPADPQTKGAQAPQPWYGPLGGGAAAAGGF